MTCGTVFRTIRTQNLIIVDTFEDLQTNMVIGGTVGLVKDISQLYVYNDSTLDWEPVLSGGHSINNIPEWELVYIILNHEMMVYRHLTLEGELKLDGDLIFIE